MFRRYCIQNVKDGIQIRVHNINNDIANHFGLFILVKENKVKNNVRKSQAQCREKLGKLGLRQNYGVVIKKRVPFGHTIETSIWLFMTLHPSGNPDFTAH